MARRWRRWRGGGFRGGYYGRGYAVAGTGMLATIDGTAAGAGGAAVTTRGGYFRFHGLTRITVITDQVTGMGMDQDTDTDTESSELSLSNFVASRRLDADQFGSAPLACCQSFILLKLVTKRVSLSLRSC